MLICGDGGPIQGCILRLRSRPANSKSHHHGVPPIPSIKWSPRLDWCRCRCSNSWVATKQVPRDLTISFDYKVSHARRRTKLKLHQTWQTRLVSTQTYRTAALTRVLRRVVLQPPPKVFFFFKQRFSPINCAKRFYVIVFYIYYASFDVYEVKFGGVVWVWRGHQRLW